MGTTSPHWKKYHEAAHFIEKNELDHAKAIYNELMEIDPRNRLLVHVGLATVNTRQGNYEEATKHCVEALAIDENCYEAYLALASVHYNQFQFMQALNNYKIAQAIAPDRPDAYWGLSATYRYLELPDSAAHYAKIYKQLAPNSVYNDLLSQ